MIGASVLSAACTAAIPAAETIKAVESIAGRKYDYIKTLITTTPGGPELDTLKLIKGYRGVRDGKAIDFGVYGRIEEPGRVRVGDPVELH